MSSVVAKVDALAAAIGKLANEAGREIIEVFDEIIAHVEGKTAEAAAPKSGDTADVEHSHKVEDPGHTHAATTEAPTPEAEAGNENAAADSSTQEETASNAEAPTEKAPD